MLLFNIGIMLGVAFAICGYIILKKYEKIKDCIWENRLIKRIVNFFTSKD